MYMKVLITGAEGMLGHDLIRVLEGKHQLILTTLADLDICNADKTAELVAFQAPDCVINCAAYTNVDGCETDAENAFAANAEGVKNLAHACRQSGARLLHISTDYVFDGTGQRPYVETDTVNPLSVYGQSKLAGERFVQEILDTYAIIRTEWLYGRNGKHFVGRILQLAEERDTLEVVDDQTGTPTGTADLALALEALLAVPARGIYHVTNAGSCSWYVFAKKILALAGSQTRVLPISSNRLARPARRPAYSVLDCSKFISETGHILLPWEQALENYMKA
jgi:dTDP-4-dehydrorhamnose reductase